MVEDFKEETLLAKLRGEIDSQLPLESPALLAKLIEATRYVEPRPEALRPDRNDPARYVWAYKYSSLYCFLPQIELEEFCSIIEKQISASLRDNISEHAEATSAYGKKTYDDPFDEHEARHDKLRDIFRTERDAHEDVRRLQLLDELRVISIYRSIEIARNRRIIEAFPSLEKKKLHQITFLRKVVPYWKDVFGLAEVEELRVINNCIKHSGIVSRQLEGFHSQWKGKAGAPFHEYLEVSPQRPLKEAYQRIAPYVGAYWNNFVEQTADYKALCNR